MSSEDYFKKNYALIDNKIALEETRASLGELIRILGRKENRNELERFEMDALAKAKKVLALYSEETNAKIIKSKS